MPARAFTALSGLVLLASLFLPWYDATAFIITRGAFTETRDATISAWDAFAVVDVLLAALAFAIVGLALRRFPGPATAFAGLATALVAVKLVWRPGDLGTSYGVWIALAAALAALVAARGISGRA
ncbi:hypothetical protein C8N24_5791 [Solirubrobacter pauli]|uniref:Uncharacterized protein n=1 Tax=Solirubrobacter pauli TaxID=166793 RepID=A0A660L4I5_9ACTN|nr:hypothetical protein [Solirubrobacter pauli]RKQ87762.1 hypothetical protein C8N24_5791 [Solirubrobacter pauli]